MLFDPMSRHPPHAEPRERRDWSRDKRHNAALEGS